MFIIYINDCSHHEKKYCKYVLQYGIGISSILYYTLHYNTFHALHLMTLSITLNLMLSNKCKPTKTARSCSVIWWLSGLGLLLPNNAPIFSSQNCDLEWRMDGAHDCNDIIDWSQYLSHVLTQLDLTWLRLRVVAISTKWTISRFSSTIVYQVPYLSNVSIDAKTPHDEIWFCSRSKLLRK